MSPITLERDDLALTVLPERGAKVTSLRDRRTSREWLTAGHYPLPPIAPGAPFDGDACFGWDECFPSIAPEPGRRFGDHGDLWTHPWQVDDLSEDATTLSCALPALACRFSRRFTLSGDTLTCEYGLECDRPVEALWSMHPLLALATGARLDLPTGARISVDSAFGPAPVAAGQQPTWPVEDLVHFAGPEAGWAVKLFATGLPAPEATITDRAGSLRFVVDADDASASIGVWINCGGWPSQDPLTHLAVEPAFATADDFAAGRPRRFPAGATRWVVHLALAPGSDA